MSQDDLIIANQAFPATRADINSNLQALGSLMSGSSAPGTTYAYMWWADTTNAVLKQRNAANSGWLIRASLSDTLVITKTSTYTVTLADFGKTILCDATGGSMTINLLPVATVGNPFPLKIKKIDSSANTVTIDADGSEVIDDATTLVLSQQYDAACINSNATKWYIEATAGTITESKIVLSDVTTNNASTSKHGFMKKLPNDATKFYDGTGAFSTPVSMPAASSGNLNTAGTDTIIAVDFSTYSAYQIYILGMITPGTGGSATGIKPQVSYDGGSTYNDFNATPNTFQQLFSTSSSQGGAAWATISQGSTGSKTYGILFGYDLEDQQHLQGPIIGYVGSNAAITHIKLLALNGPVNAGKYIVQPVAKR